jgi:uncharacterized protein (DUF3820 family)
VKLLGKYKTEALADVPNLYLLTILHSFSTFSGSVGRPLPVTLQNIFRNVLHFKTGSSELKKSVKYLSTQNATEYNSNCRGVF